MCNTEPCPTEWFVSKWDSCTVTCGGGWRRRTVICKRKVSDYDEEQMQDSECPKPKERAYVKRLMLKDKISKFN